MLTVMILAYSVASNQPTRHEIQGASLMRILFRLLILLTVCAAGNAHAAETSEKTYELTIAGGTVPAAQRVIKVEKDAALRIRVTSDAAGELHLHGYRLEAKLVPGQPAELAFKAHATGRYPFEWHTAQAAVKTGAHRGPPLVTLEVRPK